ncbi:MAG: DUF2589 domain-containing protein [Desulfovibrio sp.]|jgi:hypothetical protein|nr:DUF2589 domain-containing protein [Desulfovibrio sp.]
MASDKSLSSLIVAIATSLTEAQRQLEWKQIETFRSFLSPTKRDQNNRSYTTPRRFKVALPSLRPDAQAGERDVYNVPYLGLLPNNGLRIDTATVDFSVTLGNLSNLDDEVEGAALSTDGVEEPQDSVITVDLGSGFGRRNGLTAKISLTVAGIEPSEGTARMINEILKSAQGYSGPGITLDAPRNSAT